MSGLRLAARQETTQVRCVAPPRDSLAEIAIFSELAPDEIAALSRRCRWRRYGAGQTILQHCDDGDDVFFVVRGSVSAIYHSASGREVRFDDFSAGEIFGELAAIDGAPCMADVVAVTDTLVAAMSAQLFNEVLRRHDTVCVALLRRLTATTRTMSQRVIEFSTLPVRSRVHAELLRLARIDADDPPETAVIAPAPTHAEIASRISTHREAVTRELSALTRSGLIERRGGDLILRDVAALTDMVEEPLAEPPAGLAGWSVARRATAHASAARAS